MKWLELKVPPLVVLVLFASAMQGLSWIIPSLMVEVPGNQMVALVLAVLGFVVVAAGVLAFRASKTTVDPRTPEAASTVVASGVYRRSRNPMYLGFLFILAAWAVYLSNFVAMILLPVFAFYLRVFQINPEERILLSKFGSRYTEYMASVPRWL